MDESLKFTIAIVAVVALTVPLAHSQETGDAEEAQSLAEIDRQVNNPLTTLCR